MSNLLKVYIGTPKPNLPQVELLHAITGKSRGGGVFGEPSYLTYLISPLVEIVARPEDSDYFLLPHAYQYLKSDQAYLSQFTKQAQEANKKIIVFVIGDTNEHVPIANSLVFRMSQYASSQKPNENILPAFVSDLGAIYGVTYRDKKERPTVGFVGWARQNGIPAIKTGLKNLFLLGAHKKGIIFRQSAMQVLARSTLVSTNFIVRDSYNSGSRCEYIENIKNTDFTLAPKGDGNFSARFYEVLSLGRLPILIDTESVLPFEDEINYDEFIVRVPYQDIARTPEYVNKFYEELSSDDFVKKQMRARYVFENYLRIDKYLGRVFTKEFLAKYHV